MPIYADDPLRTLESEPQADIRPDPIVEAILRRAGVPPEAAAGDAESDPIAAIELRRRAEAALASLPPRAAGEAAAGVSPAHDSGASAVAIPDAGSRPAEGRPGFWSQLGTAFLDRERARLGIPSRQEVADAREKRDIERVKAMSDLEANAARRRQLELILGRQLMADRQKRLDAQRAADEANLGTEQGVYSEADPAYQAPVEAPGGGPPSDADVQSRLEAGGASPEAARALVGYANLSPEARAGRGPVATLPAVEDESGAFLPERRVPLTTVEMAAKARREAEVEKFRSGLAGKVVAPGSTVLGPDARPYFTAPERGAAGSGAAEATSPGLVGDELLATLSPQDQANVTGLVEGRLDPRALASMRRDRREYLMGLAARVDPTFNMGDYPTRVRTRADFATGKAAANVRSLNTVMGHLGDFAAAAEKLDNAPMQLWNRIINFGLTQAGDPRVTNFEKAAIAVESELAALFKGMGATDQEIKAWRETLNSAQSPRQLQEGVATLIKLVESRMGALSDQYAKGMGREMRPDELLSPKSRRIYERLTGGQTGGGDSQPGGGGDSEAGSQPGASAGPAIGTRRMIGGQLGEWDGRGWKAVQ